ncbi:MAG: hypothetical protein ACRDWI_00120 [Jiangellaceae bacterium]
MATEDRAPADVRRRLAGALLLAATFAYAATASTTKVNSAPAAVAVALPGVVVAVRALRAPSRDVTAVEPLGRTTLLWASLTLVGLLWEAGAYLGEHTVGQYEHPTLSVLAAPLLHEPGARFAAWSLWLLAGWRLLRR